MSRDLCPLMWATNPIPQASRSVAGSVGNGRVESELHSLELLRPPSEVAIGGTDEVAVTRSGGRTGRPVRTSPVPYLLILALLTGEWIGRRRGGLR